LEEVVHNAVGSIGAPAHQVTGDFGPYHRDQVDEGKGCAGAILAQYVLEDRMSDQ